jgi:hypothetical protein
MYIFNTVVLAQFFGAATQGGVLETGALRAAYETLQVIPCLSPRSIVCWLATGGANSHPVLGIRKRIPFSRKHSKKRRRRLVAHERQRQARPGLPLRLMFEEEARLGRISEPRRVGAPPGIRPEVPMPIVREYSYA